MKLLLREDLTLWAVQTIPLQTFFLFLFFSPDAFFMTGPFPALYHGVLYYWSIYRPESFSLPLLLIGSLFFDTLVGYSLGHTFLEILCVFFGVLYQRKNLINAPFVVVWSCFVFYMAFFVLVASLMNFLQLKLFLLWDLFYAFIWTSLSYPLLNWFLKKVNDFLENFHARD